MRNVICLGIMFCCLAGCHTVKKKTGTKDNYVPESASYNHQDPLSVSQAGRITMPMPKKEDYSGIPEGWTPVKTIGDKGLVLCRNPQEYLIPDISDQQRKSFVLWNYSLTTMKSPDIMYWNAATMKSVAKVGKTRRAVKQPKDSGNVQAFGATASSNTVEANVVTVSPVDTPQSKDLTTIIPKAIEMRDQEWKTALSSLFPLDGAPCTSPEEVADLISSIMDDRNCNETQSKANSGSN